MQIEIGESKIYYERQDVPGSIPLLFIHSALGTSRELDAARSRFTDRTAFSFDLPGHGRSETCLERPTIRQLAEVVLSFLKEEQVEEVDIIGYSLGGYIGLELATLQPAMVRSVTAHATKFYWTPEVIEQSVSGLDAEEMRRRSLKHWNTLEQLHPAGLERTLGLVRSVIDGFRERQLDIDIIKQSGVPILLTLGDSDELIPLNELLALFEGIGLEQSSMAVFPHSRHAIRTVSADQFELAVRQFWSRKLNVT